ncbi:hypothetical protein LCGC14_2327220 [marine sediment metagenome]|uniref:Uncharacterized protein n=1 Tax=marine sediment metagenome TaxID=412755 RepID=A0A0F9CGQ3_9ZZZZ
MDNESPPSIQDPLVELARERLVRRLDVEDAFNLRAADLVADLKARLEIGDQESSETQRRHALEMQRQRNQALATNRMLREQRDELVAMHLLIDPDFDADAVFKEVADKHPGAVNPMAHKKRVDDEA